MFILMHIICMIFILMYYIFVLGPTLSTSTSSFERNDPHDPNLSLLSTKMFEKTSDYLMGELTITEVGTQF